MPKLEILRFPDPRLRKKGKPVDEVTPELVQLADDMLETMYDEQGIGLAAAQVNRQVRLVVIDTRQKDQEGKRYQYDEMTGLEKKLPQPLVLFNPEVIEKKGKTSYEEGCLSVPGYFETVERADHIRVRALGKDGQPFEFEVDGLLAICIQHEIDHLDGKVFIDRLSPIKANRLKNKIKKFGYDTVSDSTELESAKI